MDAKPLVLMCQYLVLALESIVYFSCAAWSSLLLFHRMDFVQLLLVF